MSEDYLSLSEIEERDKKLAKFEEKEYIRFIDDITLSMRDPSSRRFIGAILSWCGFYDSVIPDGQKALHAEGRRFIGQQIKAILDEVDPEIFFNIQLEDVKNEKAKQKILSK